MESWWRVCRHRAECAFDTRATATECSGARWRRCEDGAVAVVFLRADDARRFHRLDQARRPVVADLETSLHARDRTAARFGDDAHRLVVQRVGFVARAAAAFRKARRADD